MFADLVDNYAVALVKPNIMLAVLDIIVENVPELVALDLSDNKLYALDNLSVLSVKLPNLKVLYVGKNRVSYCIHGDTASTDMCFCCVWWHCETVIVFFSDIAVLSGQLLVHFLLTSCHN
jgi:hypothetical protein